jgi:hypothetical protein
MFACHVAQFIYASFVFVIWSRLCVFFGDHMYPVNCVFMAFGGH